MPPPELNVLFITVDQWRGDCLSALDHAVVQTPNLDRLAATGTLFRRHFAQAAPCGPSRASLYTGLYLMNHRSVNNGTPLDRRFTNVALEARALGYDPVLFGYTDTTVDPRTVDADDPRLRSYEEVLPGFSEGCHLPEGDPAAWLAWLRSEGVAVPDDWREMERDPENLGYDFEHTQTAFLSNVALEHVTHATQPWFVHLSFLRPHPPFVPTPPYASMYDPEAMPPPVRAHTRDEEGAVHPLAAGLVRHPFTAAPDDDGEQRRMQAAYHACQTEVDAQLGRLLDWLDASGEVDRTLVVLTSDHGEQLGDHWVAGKLGWFDASYHVPLLVRDPRPSADGGRGTVVSRFTEHVDVMPTMLDLLGAPVPLQCDGRPLTPFLQGATPGDWREEVHWEFDLRDPQNLNVERALGVTMEELCLAVLRDDHGQYVHFPALPPLFFDLDRDAHMLENRAADPACAQQVLEYAQRMLSWRLRNADRSLASQKVSPIGLVTRGGPRR